MCNKTVDNNALRFDPNCYKTQKMCNKAVGTCSSVIQFVAKCFKTKGMCNKAVDTCPFVFDSVPD